MQTNTLQDSVGIHDEILIQFIENRYIRPLQLAEQELLSEYIAYEKSLMRVSDLSSKLEKVKKIAQKNKILWFYLMQPIKLRVARIVERLDSQREKQEWENKKQDISLKKSGIYERMKVERMLPVIDIDRKYYAISLWRVADRFIKAVAWDAVVLDLQQLQEIIALQKAQDQQPFKSPWKNNRSLSGYYSPVRWGSSRTNNVRNNSPSAAPVSDNASGGFSTPQWDNATTINTSTPSFTGGGGESGWWGATGSF